MMRSAAVLALVLAAHPWPAEAGFPGNGYWSVKPNRRSSTQLASQRTRRSEPLDIYPPYSPHFDNTLYSRGMTTSGLNAYDANEYRGRPTSLSYGYWDGGFNPGIYGFSQYPHFDRPGFTYWWGGQ